MVGELGKVPNDELRLGTWRNPPLAYVVAELRISPYYSLKEAIPRLQNALREHFPRTIEGSELVIDPSSPPAPQPVWQLISERGERGVFVSTRSISLHATAYADFPDFLERWTHVFSAISGAELNPFVERAGLRYVDLIVPGDNRQPQEYLSERLQGVPTMEGSAIQSSICGATLSVNGLTLQVHTAAPTPEGMLFAPNFNALPLQKPPIMRAAEERTKNKKHVGYIDTDCWAVMQKVFDAQELRGLYERLHNHISGMFTALLSDLALKEWK
jgi:uncharacterized protein (TIGR04255 family)